MSKLALPLALLLAPVFSDVAAQSQDSTSPLSGIEWAQGPAMGQLGKIAQVRVPESCRFTGEAGTKRFMELTQNPVAGGELGVLLCNDAASDSAVWFVVFTYNESGYVKDDEKKTLDAEAILSSLKRGNVEGNKERRKRGWDELELTGWARAPYYDSATNNLTWALRVQAKGSASASINHSVRLLGRGGVMNADLVADPEQMERAVATFDALLADYSYTDGNRYGEWREGDKVAEYGLTALIAGGAGIAAAKLGLFGKMWKVIIAAFIALKKLIIVAVLAIAAFVKKLFSKQPQPAAASNSKAD